MTRSIVQMLAGLLGNTSRLVCISFILIAIPIGHSSAQDLPGDRTGDGVFTIAVYGDSMADGIWTALYRALQRDERFEVLDRARASTGIARPDYYDWQEELEQFLIDDPIDAAVFSVGLNDMQSAVLREGGHHDFRTPEWDETYQERVSLLMETLRANDVPTFWIGLPIMRSGNYSNNIAHLNGFFETLAPQHGATYVPLWDLTASETGEYTSHFPDETGRTRRMRNDDGIHFTTRGYEMLGREVLEAMHQELQVFQTGAAE
ncbi:MAG: DUF459 domain-containing protein [Pseudomonadota bacterium]